MSVGVTGVQTIGKNHTSQVMGHGSRGSWVSSLMGHMGHGSHIGHSCDPLSALGRMGFNPCWKNRDPDCKFPSKVQPASSFGGRLNLLLQNPTPAAEISQIEPWVWVESWV